MLSGMLHLMSSSQIEIESEQAEAHGVRLTHFLEKEWDALYTTRGAWCRKVGLADSTVYRWSQGVEPDMRNMVLIAQGLNRKLVDILYAAGYLGEDEYKVRTVTPVRERPSLVDAIRTDPSLSTGQREALLAVHAAFETPNGTKPAKRVRVARKA